MTSKSDNRTDDAAGAWSKGGLVFNGLVGCLALWLFVLIPTEVGTPVTLFGAPPEGLPPSVMPKFVLIGLMVLACVGMYQSRSSLAASVSPPTVRVWVTCAASFVFAALLVPLGFILASAATVALISIYLGGRSWLGLVLSAGLVPVLLYFAFTRLLHVSLPAGLLGI